MATRILLTIFFSILFSSGLCAKSSTNATAISDEVYGKIKINGLYYTAMCDCGDDDASNLDVFGPKCDPSELTLHQDIKGTGMTTDQIRTLIGMPAELNFVNVESTSFTCLDGRKSKPTLGTPGGDAGEFLLALYVYQSFLGRAFIQDAVTSYLKKYLDYMKHDTFVMCTDDAAISHIETVVETTGLNLKSPRTSLKDAVLDALSDEKNNGDTHIKLLLQHPEKYAIDKNTVKYFLNAFYSILWENDQYSSKLTLEILPGDHNESAFIEVRSTEACTKSKLAPLIRSKQSGSSKMSMLVNHLDAVSIRRLELATFFTTYINPDYPGMTTKEFYSRMNSRGLAFLEVTGGYTAKGLPFYTVMID